MNLVQQHFVSSQSNGLRPETLLFVQNSNQTNQIDINAVNYLVESLFENNLWNKIDCLYPMVGDNLFNHKFNLKSPYDTNVDYRLVFYGGVTANRLGLQGNGSNGYANTFFNRQIVNKINVGFTVCIGTNNSSTGDNYDYGVSDGGGTLNEFFSSKTNNTTFDKVAKLNNAIFNVQNGNDAKGVYSVNKIIAINNFKFWKNSNILSENTTAIGGLSADYPYLLAVNIFNASVYGYSNQRLQLVAMHAGFTDTEIQTFHTIIDNFNNMLSRKTW